MLKVVFSPNLENEKRYVVDVLLGDFLAVPYELSFNGNKGEIAVYNQASTKSLILPDIFFDHALNNWLKSTSLPQEPLKRIEIDKFTNIPVIFGKTIEAKWIDYDSLYCEIDIFGSVFYTLTRYEEYVSTEKDRFDRFPIVASLAFREKFVERPKG